MIPTSLKLASLTPTGSGVRKLPFPASPKVRVAHISSGASFEGAKQFSQADWPELESYSPRVLVGTSSAFQKLVKWAERGVVALSCVDHAVFVTTKCGQAPLSDVSRVVLWQTFGVPVYELYMSSDGAMLGSECEAQEGWHIESGVQFFMRCGELTVNLGKRNNLRTGLTGTVETAICPCGRSGSRITNIQAFQDLPAIHQLAATA